MNTVFIHFDEDVTDDELEQDTQEEDLFTVSDSGEDYDDSEPLNFEDAWAEIEERIVYYTSRGFSVQIVRDGIEGNFISAKGEISFKEK